MKLPKPQKKTKILLLLLLVVILVFVILELTGKTSFILNKNQDTTIDTTSKTTSKSKSAQSDFTGGGDRKPAPSNDKASVDVNDTNGAGVQVTQSPSVSKDGQVTVYSPGKNSIVTNGSSITGKTSGQQVSFRIIDNVSGVIATGTLNVVNGNFSAALGFSTTASEGRIDVFQTKSDGTEYSVVEIPVRFK